MYVTELLRNSAQENKSVVLKLLGAPHKGKGAMGSNMLLTVICFNKGRGAIRKEIFRMKGGTKNKIWEPLAIGININSKNR